MRRFLSLFLAALALLAMTGCGPAESAAGDQPGQTTAQPDSSAPLPSPAPTEESQFLTAHPTVPDPAALGLTLTAQYTRDGLSYYFYEGESGNFAALAADYADLCRAMGYSPDEDSAGEQAIYIPCGAEGIVLAVLDGAYVAVVGPADDLAQAMDTPVSAA